jgi:mono/diheme cytochrome c family protein
MSSRRKWILITLGVLVAAFALMQLVPYRVSNPSTNNGPQWDSPRTEQLARAACFDCHSNETETAWWEDVAPLSWWITNHVDEGRAALNFSECTGSGGEADDAAETVRDGEMPPGYYTWFGMHGDAKLTKQERRELAAGLLKTLQGAGCGGEGD